MEAIRGRGLESRKRSAVRRERERQRQWQRHKAEQLKTGRQKRGSRVFRDEGEKQRDGGLGVPWHQSSMLYHTFITSSSMQMKDPLSKVEQKFI